MQTELAVSAAQTITLPAPRVFEGIATIWADLDGDGVREIIATVPLARSSWLLCKRPISAAASSTGWQERP